MTEELPLCECGCGLRVSKPGNRFINGHNQIGIPKPPRTPEHCAALSEASKNSDAVKAANDAKRSIPHSPKHNAAVIKGCEESGTYDAMRGGNDLVTHHYIYDHNDLSLNTVQMTRSDHQKLHRLLQKLGYIIPHINVKEMK